MLPAVNLNVHCVADNSLVGLVRNLARIIIEEQSHTAVRVAATMATGRSIHNGTNNMSDTAQVKRSLHPRPASIDTSVQKSNVGGSVINGTQEVLVLPKFNC
jgi:hypothetical protein